MTFTHRDTPQAEATSAINVTCDNDAPYSVFLGTRAPGTAGNSSENGSPGGLVVTTTDVVAGDGRTQTIMLHGQMQSGQTPAEQIIPDIVTVTISY